jgi:hypothetical protein
MSFVASPLPTMPVPRTAIFIGYFDFVFVDRRYDDEDRSQEGTFL